jgi:hypothetical protein
MIFHLVKNRTLPSSSFCLRLMCYTTCMVMRQQAAARLLTFKSARVQE